ncbi:MULTISPECIES: hypothetical protein [Streptomyces]|uniref:hypothetical protein n=1 Tax=Streptomyces TaxID=1883 RepID=UPI0004BD72BC|nr:MULTISPECIES: hypothetical protein [Streptomyces]MDP9954159.1 hypothetical protein [Streptomyces sp. DSM 41269]
MRDTTPPTALTSDRIGPDVRAELVARLRGGDSLDEAAAACGLTLQDVLDQVPYDPQLAIAMAGRDPYAREEARIAQRSIFLSQLALGLRISDAARAAGTSSSQIRRWAEEDPYFGQAYRAVIRYTAEFAVSKRTRANVVPERAERLFALLESGRYSIPGASTEIGIGEGAVYARRRRDKQFAARLQQALERGQAAREAAAGGEGAPARHP